MNVTASPSLPDSPLYDPPLAEAIARATRSAHAKLNKFIITRLPHALPPHADDPSIYVAGLLHIAPIYIAFEQTWRDIANLGPVMPQASGLPQTYSSETTRSAPNPDGIPQNEDSRAQATRKGEGIRSILSYMHMDGLMRTDRLKADIKALTRWPDHMVEEKLSCASQTGPLGEFVQHIMRAVHDKPHVLLAYSYIMFMALFAGGRFIRASLESAGDEFWDQPPSGVNTILQAKVPTVSGEFETASPADDIAIPFFEGGSRLPRAAPLQFFHFPTPMDGEDLKREFKRRLVDAEGILTPQERQDIVQESICIFEHMLHLVIHLDQLCDISKGHPAEDPVLVQPVQAFKTSLASRLRDSVAVTKERSLRALTRNAWKSEQSSDAPSSARRRVHEQSRSSSSLPDKSATKVLSKEQECAGGSREGDISLCPGLSKSVRFDKALPQPVRSHRASFEHGVAHLSGSFEMASRRLQAVHIASWVVVAAFGAMILGAFVSDRGG